MKNIFGFLCAGLWITCSLFDSDAFAVPNVQCARCSYYECGAAGDNGWFTQDANGLNYCCNEWPWSSFSDPANSPHCWSKFWSFDTSVAPNNCITPSVKNIGAVPNAYCKDYVTAPANGSLTCHYLPFAANFGVSGCDLDKTITVTSGQCPNFYSNPSCPSCLLANGTNWCYHPNYASYACNSGYVLSNAGPSNSIGAPPAGVACVTASASTTTTSTTGPTTTTTSTSTSTTTTTSTSTTSPPTTTTSTSTTSPPTTTTSTTSPPTTTTSTTSPPTTTTGPTTTTSTTSPPTTTTGPTTSTTSGGCSVNWESNTANKFLCDGNSRVRVLGDWNNFPNKKLLCCLSNEGNDSPPGNNVRADCEDNSSSGTPSFNEAWIKTDAPSHGGNLHAVILANGLNKPITGFFKANGDRCNQFSEFKAPSSGIQPITVNPLMTASQQANVSSSNGIENRGSRIPMIDQSNQAFSNLLSKLNSRANPPTYPDTAAEWRECPILVRAVMISSCDATSACTLEDTATSGIKSCASAQNIRFLIRVEQIATIAGRTPLKAFETTVGSAAKVDVSQLLKR